MLLSHYICFHLSNIGLLFAIDVSIKLTCMSDLDRYELFVCLAQVHSLGQAAEQLNMSKPTLSKQIKRLETDLKVDLFSRAGYRLTLSPSGELLLKQCLRLKRELDDTRMMCQQLHQEPEGALNVVAFSHFAYTLIFPKLKDFMNRFPKLQITIDTSERVPDFERDQVDIAVGFSLPIPEENTADIVQCSMGTTEYRLCATAEYFDQQGGIPHCWEALQQHRYISHTGRKRGLIKLQSGPQTLTPYLEVNSVSSMIQAALEHVGLIQLPTYKLAPYIDSKRMISVLENLQKANEPVYYYYPRYRYIQPKVRQFIHYFLPNDSRLIISSL